MIRVGVVGSKFAANLHAESLAATGKVELVAVASPGQASRDEFAARWRVKPYPTVEAMVDGQRLDLVTIAAPNRHHLPAVRAAAAAGAHVVCEKPMAMNLAEADEMIRLCREAGVLLLYAEELCFAPAYRRVKRLKDEGAFGDVFLVQHRERHDGPHASWFYDADQSGGGALLDMGCHGIELIRWLLDKRPVESVHARLGRFRHTGAAVDDHALVSLRFAGGALAVVDASWASPGGIDDRLEVLGTGGSTAAEIARGSSLLTHSDKGFGYAAEKASATLGWSHVAYDEPWHWGWHAEFRHFVDCVTGAATPQETGEDGRATLEIVMAAYASASTAQEVTLPFMTEAARPIDLWQPSRM